MLSLDGWQLLVGGLTTLITGGGIASIVALKWSKRTNEASTAKLEEEAKQAQEETDSVAIANAKEIIEMYKDSVNELTDLYSKTTKELTERCSNLEKKFRDYKDATQKRIDDLEKTVKEFQSALETKCDGCPWSDSCEKRLELGIELKKSKKTTKSK